MTIQRNPLSRLASISLCLALAFANLAAQRPAAQAAPAAPLLVDKNDDAPGGLCTAADGDCSLRSAIEIANANGVPDVITFKMDMTIVYTSPVHELTASGTTILGAPGQRIIINANLFRSVFRIRANDITLDGLRMVGSSFLYPIVWISDSAQRIRIANNVIGDDDIGFIGACGNSTSAYSGIYIDSAAIPAGPDALAWIYGNSIKCNGGSPGHGIDVDGAQKVIIGADSTGNSNFAQQNLIQQNDGDGVELEAGATANVIQNSALQYNQGNGLVINNSSSNKAFDIYFQVNDQAGVVLTNTASFNQIGCPLGTLDPLDPNFANHIKQNDGHGVLISGAGTDSNKVLCNLIGVDDDATPNVGNGGDGIRIERGGRFNIIGVDSGTRNFIGGNTGFGINLTGAGTNNNQVRGNYIGTVISGTAAVPNFAGIKIEQGASFNHIGGGNSTNRNLIAGNTGAGIVIQDSTTATNTVTNNHIGVNGSGGYLAVPNGGQGVVLANETHGNIIGGISDPNQISFNGDDGVFLTNAAYYNQILANIVMSNAGNGIQLYGAGTALNVISQTLIAHNTFDGISEGADGTLNVWTHTSIFGNGGLGIDKNTTSNLDDIVDAPFPVITAVNAATGQITGTASAFSLVEVYRVYPNKSGMGEGYSFEDDAVADGSGNWTANVEPGRLCLTAFQTEGFLIYSSSEFGPNTCRVFAPVVQR